VRFKGRLGVQVVAVDRVVIALEGEFLFGLNAFQNLDELGRAAIPVVMLKPRDAKDIVFMLEPAADNVDVPASL
jgi:hypothetical protein